MRSWRVGTLMGWRQVSEFSQQDQEQTPFHRGERPQCQGRRLLSLEWLSVRFSLQIVNAGTSAKQAVASDLCPPSPELTCLLSTRSSRESPLSFYESKVCERLWSVFLYGLLVSKNKSNQTLSDHLLYSSPPSNSNRWDGRGKLKANPLKDWQSANSKYGSFEAKY